MIQVGLSNKSCKRLVRVTQERVINGIGLKKSFRRERKLRRYRGRISSRE